jgi:hypothetical protein
MNQGTFTVQAVFCLMTCNESFLNTVYRIHEQRFPISCLCNILYQKLYLAWLQKDV